MIMESETEAARRKWHNRHARVRLAAATGKWVDVGSIVEELEREAQNAVSEAGIAGGTDRLGIDSPGAESGRRDDAG